MPEIKMQDGKSLDLYFKDLTHFKPLTKKEEAQLGAQIRQGSQTARDKLISANLRFVVNVALKYRNKGVSLEDLVSAGNQGLVRAAELFDERRGFKFISYAIWWIRQAIQVSLSEDNRTIRLPSNRVDLLNRISKISKQWHQHNDSAPQPEYIAKVLDVSVEMVTDTLMRAQEVRSLDAPVSEENEEGWLSRLSDKTQPLPDKDAVENSIQKQIGKVLHTLTPREAEIIRLYFGMGDENPLTLEEIGNRFQVTRERIRQIKAKALRHLRHPKRLVLLESLRDPS